MRNVNFYKTYILVNLIFKHMNSTSNHNIPFSSIGRDRNLPLAVPRKCLLSSNQEQHIPTTAVVDFR